MSPPDASGAPASYARIRVFNANSGDGIAVDPDARSEYTVQVSGVQRVRLYYEAQVGGVFYEGWVGGTTFSSADTFVIRPHGSQDIDVMAVTVGQGGGGGGAG